MKHINKLLAVLLLLASVLMCFSSCDETDEPPQTPVKVESWADEILNSDPDGVEYDFFFTSVKDLLYAIKHEPDKYNNAKVKILGTMQKGYDGLLYEARLVDFTADSTNMSIDESLSSQYQFRKTLDSSSSKINVLISNDAQFSVAEDGDYVKLYGSVTITRDEIYITNCEYSLIATLSERKQSVKQ